MSRVFQVCHALMGSRLWMIDQRFVPSCQIRSRMFNLRRITLVWSLGLRDIQWVGGPGGFNWTCPALLSIVKVNSVRNWSLTVFDTVTSLLKLKLPSV